MSLYWKCSKCKEKVDFEFQMCEVFDENEEADFDPSSGLMMHTISCGNCDTNWIVSISKPFRDWGDEEE